MADLFRKFYFQCGSIRQEPHGSSVFSTALCREIDVTKFDRFNILKCWRTESLAKVKTAKVVFINNPMDVFPLITCQSSLTLIVAKLLKIVTERHHSVLARYLDQIEMEIGAKEQQIL